MNIRPCTLHILILTGLSILGAILFIMETLSPQTGGPIFGKYDATRIYWLGLAGYAAVSTLIVLSVSLIFRIRKKPFTQLAAILSHVLPVFFFLLLIQFGVHDLVQNLWQNKENRTKGSSRQRHTHADRRKLDIPATPLSKHLLYKDPDRQIEPDKQSVSVESGQN